jgi:hypothetical protein
MSASNPDKSKRDHWPPPNWSAVKKEVVPPPQDPPIVGHVTLPEKVSIRYLAEIAGQELSTIVDDLVRLRCFLGLNRSLDFEDAAKLLRKYGISATRAA